ncbi:MAG TPA: immunoglobulin domain-containing protein [Bacteroidales bacterium]|nr:immunoglobulin domain-containing protein [Bacteroidales bacterium]
MTVFAGNDTTVCLSGGSIPVHGYATDYYFISWSHTGDGFFDDHTQLQTTYTPGVGDIASGGAVLYLVAINSTPTYTRMVDSVKITIVPAPQCFAGFEDAVCKGETYQLQGTASYYSSLVWLSIGDGTFDDNSQLTPLYTPGTVDCLNGEVSLLLIANVIAPCATPCINGMKLMIYDSPEVSAGSDTLLCEGVYSLTEATAINYQSLLWKSSGDGTFDDPTALNPVYEPGNNDMTGNEIFLVLQAFPHEPCSFIAADSLTLQVMARPSASVGADQTICAGDVVACSGQAQNYQQIQWVIYGGNGTYEDPNALTTTYTPGPYETGTGLCYLVLFAFPNHPCTLSESALMELRIYKNPTVQLPREIISITDTVHLPGLAKNYQSCLWQTSGDGSFADAGAPETNYYAGHNDHAMRHVQLSLTAMPLSPCQLAVTDTLPVHFEYPVVIHENMLDQTLIAGDILHLEFEIESLVPGQFQWYRNGILQQTISGSEYYVSQVSAVDAGSYYCIFTNPYFTLSSDTAHINVLEAATQTLTIPAGWSAISSCIILPNADIFAVLETIIGKIIVIYNDSGIMFPHTTKSDIDHWTSHSGYYIKTTESCTLTLQGYQQYPAPVFKAKPGWSLMPVNSLQQLSIDAFVGFRQEIKAIKEVAGTKVYWPEKAINTLQNLQPGKAYEIFNSASYEVTLNFPGCN